MHLATPEMNDVIKANQMSMSLFLHTYILYELVASAVTVFFFFFFNLVMYC